ncbi:hypothetical protein [Aliikangiella coralliicola]|uniref:Uncharacterized protein n=1 Tax=Aliikangiella coralliicola TaxID=2592383 RepID=A0A545UJA9_9GAMM|nr:hypothetical protein [Aliikangiella coralliicola]TQV89550.1 hypothetical protein FLL46_01310 [Aliikangiella coralliicola]
MLNGLQNCFLKRIDKSSIFYIGVMAGIVLSSTLNTWLVWQDAEKQKKFSDKLLQTYINSTMEIEELRAYCQRCSNVSRHRFLIRR